MPRATSQAVKGKPAVIMTNSLREKLAAGAPTIGTHYLSSDPDVPEIIGDSGLFDYAEYCAEYSAFDMQLLCHMARAGQCANLPLMIKLDQESQGFWAQAALGAGFKAVLFTDVRTPEDVALCQRCIRADTPEDGGLMGVKLRRPAMTGYEPAAYLEDLAGVVFAIMIEKASAVDDLDRVLAAAKEKGVDMTQWGPADFGLSRGQPQLMSTPEIPAVRGAGDRALAGAWRPAADRDRRGRRGRALHPARRAPLLHRLGPLHLPGRPAADRRGHAPAGRDPLRPGQPAPAAHGSGLNNAARRVSGGAAGAGGSTGAGLNCGIDAPARARVSSTPR
jgi:2-keto-3-deoxy-L-rhamnonate aldolase RhmA